MLIYNITTKVSDQIHIAWLNWLREIYIPEVLATGCFTKATVLRLLEIDDSEGPTYAVQFVAANRIDYDSYIKDFSDIMREKNFAAWGNQVIAFRSLMEVVN